MLSPSHAGTWFNCPGSTLLNDTLPSVIERDEKKSLEGTAKHALSESMFVNEISASDIVGTTDKSGILITQEFFDVCDYYTKEVFKYSKNDQIIVEQKVNFDCIYPGMTGFIDAHNFNAEHKVLRIYDAKFGHRFVPAFENPQLIIYAAGLIKYYGMQDSDQVELYISQPQCFHGDRSEQQWIVTVSDLHPYIENIKQAALDALSPNGDCHVGKWCINCPARYGCQTLQRNVLSMTDYISVATPQLLDGNGLAYEYKLLKRTKELLTARLTGLEAKIEHDINNHEVVNGISMIDKYSNLKWRKGITKKDVINMCKIFGVDAEKTAEMFTPSQLIHLGISKDIIDKYSVRSKSGQKIVIDDISKIKNYFS